MKARCLGILHHENKGVEKGTLKIDPKNCEKTIWHLGKAKTSIYV